MNTGKFLCGLYDCLVSEALPARGAKRGTQKFASIHLMLYLLLEHALADLGVFRSKLEN